MSTLPAHWCTANYLILRLNRPLQCGGDAELCFKRKKDLEHERGSGSSSSAGGFRGGSCETRTGQCSILRGTVSIAQGPLEVVSV